MARVLFMAAASGVLAMYMPTCERTYEVTVTFHQKIRPLTRLIQQVDGHDGMQVNWEIKKHGAHHAGAET